MIRKPSIRRRLHQVVDRLRSVPVHPQAIEKSVQHFRETGELPEDERLAGTIVRRLLSNIPSVSEDGTPLSLAAMIHAGLDRPPRPRDEVMDSLYFEAAHGPGLVRAAARLVLQNCASIGWDVTKPCFVERGIELDLPEYGSVGMAVIGLPERLAKPPYEAQAQHLFQRLDQLRSSRPDPDESCRAALSRAIDAFLAQGDLPEDPWLREAVLCNSELDQFFLHFIGQCDHEVMAVFATAGTATGEERERAIATLQDLAAAGRLGAPGT